MSQLSVLIVLTSKAMMPETGKPTGVWLEELAVPYYEFIEAGAEVSLVSIKGGAVPVDPASLPSGEAPEELARFLNDPVAQKAMVNTRPITEVTGSDFEAVFLPGGHGTMWDLPDSSALSSLLAEAWESGSVLAAVCHGGAGLVNVNLASGEPLVKGRRVTSFSDSEEAAAGLTEVVPFLLETRLRLLGAEYQAGPDFENFIQQDGRLITGQNPASSKAVAQAILTTLEGE